MSLFYSKVTTCALVLYSALVLCGCYSLQQAYYQNNLFNSRRLVDGVLKDPTINQEIKERLLVIKEILKYAKAQGLNSDGAYKYYIQYPQPVVSYLVFAAHVDKLKPVTWWFPFVGSVPYLGFFHKEQRDKMAKKLKKQGYDVTISGAGAFSSLGWFEDPIYSPMLLRSDAGLAHLFFHELTHRTMWISSNVEFNESLAEFVAIILTKKYLTERQESAEVKNYEQSLADKVVFINWLSELKEQLQKLYSDRHHLTKEQVIIMKANIINNFLEHKSPQFKSNEYAWIKEREWNNAAILSATLYNPDLTKFKQAYECFDGQTVKKYLDAIDEAFDKVDDPFSALEGLCQKDIADA